MDAMYSKNMSYVIIVQLTTNIISKIDLQTKFELPKTNMSYIYVLWKQYYKYLHDILNILHHIFIV